MGRATYVCATCSEHFTRRYSATRHNTTIHDNRGEIVTYLEYLVRRKTVRYHASDPSLYRRPNKKRIHKLAKQLDMGRLTYVCTTCSEDFTRKYSATRHNITIHDNRGEIVPLLGYLAGRNCGRYHACDPSLYRRPNKKQIHNFRNATVTVDYMGDTFPPRGLQQQTPFQSTPVPTPLQPHYHDDASMYTTVQTAQPIDRMNDRGLLSQETMPKIQELKMLMYKYPQCYSNPDVVIKCATHLSINGDNTLLDEWLERFRIIEAINK
jgi:DNA-directed RNA polymerase subunit RPC12/RpoP